MGVRIFFSGRGISALKQGTLLVILLSGVLPQVSADEGSAALTTRRLTLDDCLQIARNRSVRVLNVRRDADIAETTFTQTRAGALPRVTATGRYTRIDRVEEVDFGDEVVEFGTLDNYAVELGVSQALYSGGRLSAALRAAGLSREYALLEEEHVLQALERDVRQGFAAVLLAREGLLVREAELHQLKRLQTRAEERHLHETIAEFDVLRAQVRLQNALPELITASNTLAIAREEFRRLIQFGPQDFHLQGNLEEEPVTQRLEALQDVAVARAPAVRMAEVVVLLRKQDVAAARADRWPSLNAFGTYQGANSYQFVSAGDQWEWRWNLGLALSWDLWDGGLTGGRISEKQTRLAKAQTDLEDLRRAVRLDVHRAYLEMRRAEASIQAREGTEGLARRALEIAETRYQSGLATQLDAADANIALSEARLGRAVSSHDRVAAVARLRFAVGGNLRSAAGGVNDE